MWGFGRNNHSQLGFPSPAPEAANGHRYSLPVHVPLPESLHSISTGTSINGAVSLQGHVYLWGARASPTPLLVQSLLAKRIQVKKLCLFRQPRTGASETPSSSQSLVAVLTTSGRALVSCQDPLQIAHRLLDDTQIAVDLCFTATSINVLTYTGQLFATRFVDLASATPELDPGLAPNWEWRDAASDGEAGWTSCPPSLAAELSDAVFDTSVESPVVSLTQGGTTMEYRVNWDLLLLEPVAQGKTDLPSAAMIPTALQSLPTVTRALRRFWAPAIRALLAPMPALNMGTVSWTYGSESPRGTLTPLPAPGAADRNRTFSLSSWTKVVQRASRFTGFSEFRKPRESLDSNQQIPESNSSAPTDVMWRHSVPFAPIEFQREFFPTEIVGCDHTLLALGCKRRGVLLHRRLVSEFPGLAKHDSIAHKFLREGPVTLEHMMRVGEQETVQRHSIMLFLYSDRLIVAEQRREGEGRRGLNTPRASAAAPSASVAERERDRAASRDEVIWNFEEVDLNLVWVAPDPAGDDHCFELMLGVRRFRVRANTPESRLRWLTLLDETTRAFDKAESGKPLLWGTNAFGQLGSGSKRNARVPEPASNLQENVVFIAAGAEFTCFLTAGDDLYVSGRVRFTGQSDATDISRDGVEEDQDPDQDPDQGESDFLDRGNTSLSPLPTLIAHKMKIRSVVCGHRHTVFINEAGGLYSWGANEHGQLGLGDFLPRDEPTLIDCGIVRGKTAVLASAGARHTVVLLASGELCAWGDNGAKQLGDESFSVLKTHTPLRVTSVSIADKAVVQLECGESHTAALTEDGMLYLWGTLRKGSAPVPVVFEAVFTRRVKKVRCGGQHCLIMTDRRNDTKHLEELLLFDGGASKDSLQPIPLPKPTPIKDFALGLTHALILAEDGIILTWVFEKTSETRTLIGRESDAQHPQTAPHPLTDPIDFVRLIACGTEHCVALAGQTYREGYHNFGQIGFYQGAWRRGNFDGYGSFRYSDGSFFEGSWVAGKKHGFGTEVYVSDAETRRYTGYWREDLRHGKGEVKLAPSGDCYNGMWKNDKRCGFGVNTDESGTYVGDWSEDKRHGFGILTTTVARSGRVEFAGEWKADHRTGFVISVSQSNPAGAASGWKDDEAVSREVLSNKIYPDELSFDWLPDEAGEASDTHYHLYLVRLKRHIHEILTRTTHRLGIEALEATGQFMRVCGGWLLDPSTFQPQVLRAEMTQIKKSIDSLKTGIIQLYPGAATALGRGRVLVAIHDVLFRRIGAPMMALLRLETAEQDRQLHRKVASLHRASHLHFGIEPRLCVPIVRQRHAATLRQTDMSISGSFANLLSLAPSSLALATRCPEPYDSAITWLQRIAHYESPMQKYSCVMSASESIHTTLVGGYRVDSIDGDLMNSLMYYSALKANIAHSHAEKLFMEAFFDEDLRLCALDARLSQFVWYFDYISDMDWARMEEIAQHTLNPPTEH
eukprot:TRINITY_DN1952_c1_g2_i2.p1 TRINITY_DN1952_c1_g2~~TRINITY_DN1952_c1_g2_i2.p1  ORF type:complete len:1460 (-),score=258.05 TRINITY_DN1952_c1_g2_i2:49-4428(-)